MSDSQAISMCCIYQIKTGKDEEFRALLVKHWPTLNRVGLVSARPARFYRGSNKAGTTFFVEMFEWKDGNSSDVAHQSPEVMSVWEPMGALTDHMEFIQLDGVEG